MAAQPDMHRSEHSIPPYNHFGKIPLHALQSAGIEPEHPYHTDHFHKKHLQAHNLINNTHHAHPDIPQAHRKPKTDSVSSKDSTASSEESRSLSLSPNSQVIETLIGSLKLNGEAALMNCLKKELYVEQQEPPPYKAPNRMDLPKKSPAAQQVVADLLKSEAPFGVCHSCQEYIVTSGQACEAMGNIYHNQCFTCSSCGRTLRGKAFYSVHGRIFCEEDYMYSGFQQTIEKCEGCGHLIMDMILQALGKPFHPGCFRCAQCNDCLDGVPFTVDHNNKVYCVSDFYRLFAPKCAACGLSIVPINGSDETVRVVALDSDYHIDCYHCEKCKIQLTDELEKRCYPIGKHLFCYDCHLEMRSLNSPSPTLSNSSSLSLSTLSSASKSTPKISYDEAARQNAASSVSKLLANTMPNLKSDANTRLMDKISRHIELNKNAKRKLSSKTDHVIRPSEPSRIPPSHELKHFTPPLENPYKTGECYPTRSTLPSMPHSPPFYAQRQRIPETSDSAIDRPPTVSRNNIVEIPIHHHATQKQSMSATQSSLVPDLSSLRGPPLDLATPSPAFRRNTSMRRRLPLGDMIMQKRIVESLKKSISLGRTSPRTDQSPLSPTSRSPSPTPFSPKSPISLAPGVFVHAASSPLYMEAWKASEVAFPGAVEQSPVTSQEAPPRIPLRGNVTPPGRPPKIKYTNITQI